MCSELLATRPDCPLYNSPLGHGAWAYQSMQLLHTAQAALEVLAPGIAAGEVVVHDLHGDIMARCGATYVETGACELQIPNNVHYLYDGRQYCALSVTRAVLQVLYGFGTTSTL